MTFAHWKYNGKVGHDITRYAQHSIIFKPVVKECIKLKFRVVMSAECIEHMRTHTSSDSRNID